MRKTKALCIIGASRLNGERDYNDYYPTPGWTVKELLRRQSFTGGIYEPACGEGNISKALLEAGFEVYSSDIIRRGYGEQLDFLSTKFECDNIITNPPYKLALDFVLHSKNLARHKIAMFLRTAWLEGKSRYEMFQDKKFPLKTVYQFSQRVSLYKGGVEMKNSGMIAYAWFVWDKAYSGKPTIEWIL